MGIKESISESILVKIITIFSFPSFLPLIQYLSISMSISILSIIFFASHISVSKVTQTGDAEFLGLVKLVLLVYF